MVGGGGTLKPVGTATADLELHTPFEVPPPEVYCEDDCEMAAACAYVCRGLG